MYALPRLIPLGSGRSIGLLLSASRQHDLGFSSWLHSRWCWLSGVHLLWFFTMSLWVFLCILYLGGFQSSACLVVLDSGFLSVCPIHFHFLFLMVISSSSCWVRLHSSLLFQRYLSFLLMNGCSLVKIPLFIFHVLHPYKRTVLTLELTLRTLWHQRRYLDCFYKIGCVFGGQSLGVNSDAYSADGAIATPPHTFSPKF